METEKALETLKDGGIVLVHDAGGREDETDMVAAAEHTTPQQIARFRRDGGGLICAAIDSEKAKQINLPFIVDVLETACCDYPLLSTITADDIPYDEKSSFSLMVNHRKTFTGITDIDRALTVSELGKFFKKDRTLEDFGRNFRSAGHIPLLISSGLENREGHTELTVALMRMAGLSPVSCICEMMDHETHKAFSADKAKAYAQEHGLPYLEADEVKEAYLKW